MPRRTKQNPMQTPVKAFKRHGLSKFTRDKGREINRRIAEGESLNAICKSPGMPSKGNVIDWVMRGSEYDCGDIELSDFSEQHRRARLIQMIGVQDELREIADNDVNDMHNGRPNNVRVQRDKLRSDNLKWIAARLAPQLYGDKLELEHAGKNGAPIQVETRDLARTIMEVFDSTALEIVKETATKENK